MIVVRLPTALEERLATLAEETGRTKSYHVREALEEYIQDMEDVCIAEKRLEDIRAGRSRTYTLEEVEAELGLGD